MRILSLPYEQILEETKNLQNEVKEIKHSVIKLCWYMRGGVTIDEAFALSKEEQTIISNIVKDNLETTKKSGLPFF